MSASVLTWLFALAPLFFGIVTACFFAGIPRTHRDVVGLAVFFVVVTLLRGGTVLYLDLKTATAIGPFITHLIMYVFLTVYCRCPPIPAVISILTAFLCAQMPYWMSYFLGSVTSAGINLQIVLIVMTYGAFLALFVKCFAKPIHAIIYTSSRTGLAFGLAPISYYLFYHVAIICLEIHPEQFESILGLLTFLISISYIVFSIEYNRELHMLALAERERDLLSAQTAQAYQNLSDFHRNAEQARIYRHDMRHHLSVVAAYLENEETEKAKQYLRSAIIDIDSFTPRCFCENALVDLLLSMFAGQAEAAGIMLQVEAVVPKVLTISETDLCALLSNALENAIHATQRVGKQQRIIEVQCSIVQKNLLIQVDNPVLRDLEFLDGIPKTNEDGHGLGTRSIVNIVHRYNGIYHFSCKDHWFSLRVALPQRVDQMTKVSQ